MKIRYSFRTEKKILPDAVTLMETTRMLHHEFILDPLKFWNKYEKWLKPMNSLMPGHFISISDQKEEFAFQDYFDNTSMIKLEFVKLGHNYAKITFEIDNPLPYKVPSGKIYNGHLIINTHLRYLPG